MVSGTLGRMTLTDFLLARITEDEAGLRSLGPTKHQDSAVWAKWDNGMPGDYYPVDGPDPQRLLADCEAKRRIVAEYTYWLSCQPADVNVPATVELFTRPLRHLAAIYADHPDYQDEWAPELTTA